MKKVYISGALTGVPHVEDLKALYEKIAKFCEARGWEAYVPHLNSDPLNDPDLTPRRVYDMDHHEVITSDMVIAYVGWPSLGVGQELEIACQHDIPLILLAETDLKVSRMALGNPLVVKEVRYSDEDDLFKKLAETMDE